MTPFWRPALDALAFRPAGHEADCVLHRRAFRVLIGRDPDPEACRAFFDREAPAFAVAAAAKIRRRAVPAGLSFHLTSRDVRAALAERLDPVPDHP